MSAVQVSNLAGAALDWAVAQCDGRRVRHDPMGFGQNDFWVWEEVPSGRGGVNPAQSIYLKIGSQYAPSSDWSQGGPIIEGEKIDVNFDEFLHSDSKHCRAWITREAVAYEHFGPSPLIAAMRCYVASRMGDEIKVPGALITAQQAEEEQS